MRSVRERRRADRQVGNGIVLVVMCFLAFRLFALLLLQYGGVFGSSSDFDYYYAMAQQTERGYWPYLSYWSEYPPIFPWLVVGVYRLAETFGGTPSSATFSQLLHGVLLGFDLGNLLLIFALARRIYGQTVGLRSAWVYATLFAPVFVWLGWFDPMPIFWMLVSIWLLVRRKLAWAGVACGIGIVTKIFPGFVLLVAVREVIGLRPSRRGVAAVLTFAIPCAMAAGLVVLPFAVANPPIFATSVRAWFSRLPWETFWAVADGYYLFGIVPSLPARVGWPTYATPALASSLIGAASLVALAGSLFVAYVVAWDGSPASTEEVDSVPWTIPLVARTIQQIAAAPSRLASQLGVGYPRPLPRVAVAGLEAVVPLAEETRVTYAPASGGSVALSEPLSRPETETSTDTFDERAFRLVACAAALYATLFLVTSGYSPQFMLWMVPYAVILLPSIEAFIWVTAFTLVVIVGERYLYYWYFPPDGVVLSGIVLVRSLLLLGLLGEVGWQLGVPRVEVWPRVRGVAIAVTVIAFLAVSTLMLKSFADGGWGRAVALDPARLGTVALRQTTDQYDAILSFQAADYRYLAPWLGDRAFYLLTDQQFVVSGGTERTMRALARSHTGFVVVDRGKETESERGAVAWLAAYGTQISSSIDETGLRTTRYQIAPQLAWPAAPPSVTLDATFGNDIELVGYSLQPASAANGKSTAIDFYWKPTRSLGQLDLALTPGQGTASTGEIGSTFPTSEWTPGQIVVDREILPFNTSSLTVSWKDRATGRVIGNATLHLDVTAP